MEEGTPPTNMSETCSVLSGLTMDRDDDFAPDRKPASMNIPDSKSDVQTWKQVPNLNNDKFPTYPSMPSTISNTMAAAHSITSVQSSASKTSFAANQTVVSEAPPTLPALFSALSMACDSPPQGSQQQHNQRARQQEHQPPTPQSQQQLQQPHQLQQKPAQHKDVGLPTLFSALSMACDSPPAHTEKSASSAVQPAHSHTPSHIPAAAALTQTPGTSNLNTGKTGAAGEHLMPATQTGEI